MNHVINNIMTRATVREFTPGAQISADTLLTLVKAGMAAPTAMDQRPWDFIAVTDRDVLDALDQAHTFAHLANASAAIVVCGNGAKMLRDELRDCWIQDCSAAAENILLAAHSLGLGAVWCGVYPEQTPVGKVSAALALPADVIPLCIITLGQPAAPVEPHDKFNPAALHLNRW